ncbi:Globin family and Globin-like domain and Globin, structural domain-containing protein [Strongyloides ratti]|uniref:Globin family and Globin-like domain and Globin, structural domain-containing protein n=1 Tax=Strongyloides ratti TaxID=34506 RepID=A0A090LL00_STRRB|nr:Globin family and Globin-like domain and Globin, structural domain-containing protein [Strongyloides ratti]CEF68848.1 Globin family and Globin-like domain and Globin, structural domain-containing protein [Strongyloides ratti]
MGKIFSKKKVEPDLTNDEIEAIREIWSRAKNENVGRKILLTLIEKKPKFAEYFGIGSENVDPKELMGKREFQLQAHRIQGFLDTAVGSLGYCPMSSIYDMAHRIGQIHFYKGVNFGADNWLVFKKVTVDQVSRVNFINNKDMARKSNTASINKNISEDSEDNLEIRNIQRRNESIPSYNEMYEVQNCLARLGWNKFMTVIVREMKRGFLEEAMRNCKEDENLQQQ